MQFYCISSKLQQLRENMNITMQHAENAVNIVVPAINDIDFTDVGYDLSDHVDVQNLMDYLSDECNNNIDIVADNGKVVNLYYTHNVISGYDDDCLYCRNHEGEDTLLIHKYYSEGLGGYVYRKISDDFINLNGDEISVNNLSSNIVDTWASNTILTTALDQSTKYLDRGLTWDRSTIDNFISDFKDGVNQTININASACPGAVEMYHKILSYSRSGLSGIILMIKKLYESLNTIDEDDNNGFSFINNTDFASTAFWGGVLDAITGVLDTIAMVLITTCGKVIGIATMVISFITKIIGRLIGASFDDAVYASYIDDNGMFLPEFPFNFWNQIYSRSGATGGDYIRLKNRFGLLLDQYGACSLVTPLFTAYLWYGTDSENPDINVQVRPAGIIDYDVINSFPSIVTKTLEYGALKQMTYTLPHSYTESDLAAFMNALFEATDDWREGSYTAEQTDLKLKQCANGSFNGVAFMIGFLQTLKMQPSGMNDRIKIYNTDNTSVGWGRVQYMASEMFTATQAPNMTPEYASWDLIIGTDETLKTGYYCIQDVSHFVETCDLLCHFYDYINTYNANNEKIFISPCNNIPVANISIPKYDKGQLIRNLILTGVVVAIAATVTVITFVKAKRHINSKRANLAANSESAWEDYKDNPTSANYKKYRKSVKKNNRFARLFGGTKYSTDGFWGSTESNQSICSEIMDSINNNADADLDTLDNKDILGVSTVIKLIRGDSTESI